MTLYVRVDLCVFIVAAISRPNKYCIIALYLGKTFLLQQAVSKLSSVICFVLPCVHSTINYDGFTVRLIAWDVKGMLDKLNAFLSRPVLVLHVTR